MIPLFRTLHAAQDNIHKAQNPITPIRRRDSTVLTPGLIIRAQARAGFRTGVPCKGVLALRLLRSLHDVLDLLPDDLPGAGGPRLCLSLLEFPSLEPSDVRVDPVDDALVLGLC